MPGVVFLIVVPTANFERELTSGQKWDNNEHLPVSGSGGGVGGSGGGNNLNINLPDNNAILRLEVELRDKNAYKNRRGAGGRGAGIVGGRGGQGGKRGRHNDIHVVHQNKNRDNLNVIVPMEKILEELLAKLEIDHVTWSSDKKDHYYHVVFPLQSGEPCETTLHCLTELGIGVKFNSSVSVLPCSVSYDAITNAVNNYEDSDDDGCGEELSKWNNFVESIKSKLTVKQVVDGVRAGGSLSFDYILLIVTADSLAALGLVENNAPNIVAAMLVSPLMGPVMSITFGTIISDRDLMKVGFVTLAVGIFISLLFGFIFGLILGTTEMPWGFTDWPTEEMKGRGNARSLWMGVVWALTSGTGVAVALLQGAVGPLIGVAISASLLPPVVNCGLFWALACIWLIYPDIKMPHLKGEPYVGNSSYEFIYTNYIPTEFFINGIVSGCLTIINIICIFITAIIVLKIKEVSAPYTASPDLKRFWETDIRTVRKTNRSTIRRGRTFREKLLPNYQDLNEPKNRELETVLEQAIKEATDDETFQKVKRMSYSGNAAVELTRRLGLNKDNNNSETGSKSHSRSGSIRNSKVNADLQALDRLVSSLLEHHNIHSNSPGTSSNIGLIGRTGGSIKRLSRAAGGAVGAMNFDLNGSGSNSTNTIQHTSLMPTILEQQNNISPPLSSLQDDSKMMSWPDKTSNAARTVINTLSNAPQRFSQSFGSNNNEENINLTQNMLD